MPGRIHEDNHAPSESAIATTLISELGWIGGSEGQAQST